MDFDAARRELKGWDEFATGVSDERRDVPGEGTVKRTLDHLQLNAAAVRQVLDAHRGVGEAFQSQRCVDEVESIVVLERKSAALANSLTVAGSGKGSRGACGRAADGSEDAAEGKSGAIVKRTERGLEVGEVEGVFLVSMTRGRRLGIGLGTSGGGDGATAIEPVVVVVAKFPQRGMTVL